MGAGRTEAVEELKEALVGDEVLVMSYFDPQKQTEIIVDAIPVGLGGLLVQEGKVLIKLCKTGVK